MIDIKWQPSQGELRVFAIGQFILFAILAARCLVVGWSLPTASLFMVPSAIVALIGLIQPTWLRWLYLAWMILVFPIGWAVSHLLLAAVFFLCIVPLGLILKCMRIDPLTRRWEPDQNSYWEQRKPTPSAQRYFRPF